MPEGDVLLRVGRRLHQALAGEILTRSELRSGALGAADLTGMGVRECVSHGKNVLIRLDSGITVHTHLKMDGTWRVEPTTVPAPEHRDPRVRVVLANRRWTCVSRLTGEIRLLRTREEGQLLGRLGPDLLAGHPGAADHVPPDFAVIAARARAAAVSRTDPRIATIGAVLLDQRLAAGIGTIYLAESLWITRVHPLTPAADLSAATIEAIYHRASALMARSAEAPSLTATGDLRPGWRTHVHGRDRRPCRRCGAPIEVTPVGRPPLTRPAFFCPACQQKPKGGDPGP